MRKIIIIFISFIILIAGTYASGSKEDDFSQSAYYKAVEMGIRTDFGKNQNSIAFLTYSWYNQKCKGNWNQDLFNHAVEQGIKNCENSTILAAAKAGAFGEKVLKALIVSAGDAAEASSNWLERNSDRYDKKNN